MGTVKSPRTSSRRPRPRPLFLRKRLLVPLSFISIVLLTYGCMWWYTEVENPVTSERETRGDIFKRTLGVLTRPETSIDTVFHGSDQLTVLLLGLDHVPATKGDPGRIRRCDSIIVAKTDFRTKQIRLLSIPRDGWARHFQDGKSFGYERLAHAFSLGQQYGLKHDEDLMAGGIARSRETVEQLLDLQIDHYVVVQFEGMVELVDAISPNGLLVDVEKNMKYTDRAGGLYIDLKAGEQQLGGEELLGYARFRKDSTGDIGRMGRQQKVLKLLLAELTRPQNVSRLPKVASILSENVETSLDSSQLLALAQYLRHYDAEAVQSATLQSWYNLEHGNEMDIPGLTVDQARSGGYHVQGIFAKDIATAVEFLNDLEPPPPPEPEETETAESDAESETRTED